MLVSRPFAEAGFCDDFSYIFTAKRLADTGHLHYVGWAGAMLGWQVYAAAVLFKLFSFSFTTARVVTWITAAATAFLLQRVLVRSGANERNALIGSLTFVLSPVFFMLSSTFMTDVEGVFGLVVCLYCCLRAWQSVGEHAQSTWIVAAVALNVLLGTSRQVSWLGTLCIVPATLWLLRGQRHVLRLGAMAAVAGGFAMLALTAWFEQQPFTMTDSVAQGTVITSRVAMAAHVFRQAFESTLELPLLLLPVVAIFLPLALRGTRKVTGAAILFAVLYAAAAWHWRYVHPDYLLEPTTGNWLGIRGYIEASGPRGNGPTLLSLPLRAFLTLGAIGGTLGIFVLFTRREPVLRKQTHRPSLSQLCLLLLPYTIVYAVVLIPRGVSELFDRYLIGLLLFPLILLVRVYQDRVKEHLPTWAVALVCIVGGYSICCVHNAFAQARAEIALDESLQAAGTPRDHVDFGWAYNGWLELEKYGYINNPAIRKPANVFMPVRTTIDPACYIPAMSLRYLTPDYGISYDPTLCEGAALPQTASYRTWPTGQLTTLYVVRYTPLR